MSVETGGNGIQTTTSTPPSTDIILVDTLRLSACIGPDCWGKTRAQPIELTLYLHLVPMYLNISAASDDVLDSVHYGQLTKDISRLVAQRFSGSDSGSGSGGGGGGGGSVNGNGDGKGVSGADDLVRAVSECAFSLGGGAIAEVRVVLGLPKMVLLASGGLSVDTTFYRTDPGVLGSDTLALRSKKVSVHDLVLPVIIGVNPPEREERQRVVINVTFYEDVRTSVVSSPPDYQRIMSGLVKEMEPTSYLTLEKFVMHIVRFACLASPKIAAVTARAQKPRALSFAQSSGVEITRQRSAFV